MKRSNAILFLVALIIMLAVVAYFTMSQNNRYFWGESLRTTEDQPYDVSIFYNLLEKNGTDTEIIKLEKSLKYELENRDSGKAYTYIAISSGFYPDSTELNALLAFAKQGNSVFISAKSFGTIIPLTLAYGEDSVAKLKEHLNNTDIFYNVPDSIHAKYDEASTWSEKDSIYQEYKDVLRDKAYNNSIIEYLDEQRVTSLQLTNDHSKIPLYILVRKDTISREWAFLNLPGKPLAIYPDGQTACVSIKYGKGKIIFSSTPIIFSNYYLLKQENFVFVNKLLSATTPATFLVDDISRYQSDNSLFSPKSTLGQSPLSFILSQEALKWAWYTLIVAVLLFVSFKSKRKQRIIPILKPNLNTTLAYAKMFGSLQLKDKDNTAKGKEIMQHFMYHLRTKNRWQKTEINDELKSLLLKMVPEHNREIQIVLHLGTKSIEEKPLSDLEIINLFNYTKLLIDKI